nr:MAG TPA: hypothetical protein [Caudoviricetes sp.]
MQRFHDAVIVLFAEHDGVAVFRGYIDDIAIGDSLIDKTEYVFAECCDVCIGHKTTSIWIICTL